MANTDGTLKDLRPIGNADIDPTIEVIRNQGQSKNFKIFTGIPGAGDGVKGNIWILDDTAGSGDYYIACKIDETTWKKVAIT